MKVRLYTSLSGIRNAVEGKQVYAYDMPTTLENLEIIVDVNDIESVDHDGTVIIKAAINYSILEGLIKL